MSGTTKVDLMMNGFTAAKLPNQIAAHPVETVQRELRTERATSAGPVASLAFGQGFDVRQKMDIQILNQFRRPSMLPSSHVGIETLLGIDEDIDFSDFLGEPVETIAPQDVHCSMESRFNL